MNILIQISCLIIAYLFGSIPWAVIISKKIKKIDIRDYGSKNMGATNVFRVLGFKWGLFVFLLDASKGTIFVLLMKYNVFGLSQNDFYINPLIYGVAAVIGHLFPIFAKFKGGKGVSTAAGIICAYCPLLFIVGLVIFIIITILFRFIALSSCLSVLLCFVTALLYSIISKNYDFTLLIVLFMLTIFIWMKHITNFKRIKNHQEGKINFKAINSSNEPAFIIEDKAEKKDK